MPEEPPEKRRKAEWPAFGSGVGESRSSDGSARVRVEVADATGREPPPAGPIACGLGFLDHMVDQLNSHAQLRISLQAWLGDELVVPRSNCAYEGCDAEVARLVGCALGRALREMLKEKLPAGSFRFMVPLDEALTELELDFSRAGAPAEISLAPFGRFPKGGRERIGAFRTCLTEVVLGALATSLGVFLKVRKIRGDNAHHIVEATFKSLARCLRCAMDAACGFVPALAAPARPAAPKTARAARRRRATKETSIDIHLDLDDVQTASEIATGLGTLDALLAELCRGFRLTAQCSGDTWIDEHHSAEDVMITVGQATAEALGPKAGCCRMAWAEQRSGAAEVLCVMDLSNRPSFCSDLQLDEEMAGDLPSEMVHHCFESFVTNALMTVHLVQVKPGGAKDLALAAAKATGEALKQCIAIDPRRAGATASSKGTLSK
ncbi:unnamed protein product [Effrenium voratum]|uniref:imidazoleglycerol-phosphate dehydratase n=1 Tax=Effrenium voratum TaxID=2562239 RepID=A0AA36JIQ1_9DINO|nr:unnamed protein product [Effrenium voratum]